MGLLTILFEIALLGFTAIIGYLIFIYYKHKTYFQKVGMTYTGLGLNGFTRIAIGKADIREIEIASYNTSKDTNLPFTGYTDIFTKPGVYITDLEVAKHIYVKDFDHFVNRRRFTVQKGDVLFHKMIVMMEDEQWKGMRGKLSPTFTTGKIRRMYEIFHRSSTRMSDYLKQKVGPSGGDYDITDTYSKYAMDVIASCVFGIDSKPFDNEPGKLTKFEEMGLLLQFKFKVSMLLKIIVVMGAPKLANYLGLEMIGLTPQIYFQKVVQQVLKRRRETGERQEDFLQLMMDIQQGLLKEDGNSKEILEVMTGSAEGKSFVESDPSKLAKFDDDDIAANCVLFLLAGFDTLQSLLIYTAYMLALEPEMQKKLFEEIRQSMAANGGKLTYDGIHEMKYLDMFINETLRIYPPAPRTERVCTKNYKIPGTNSVIEKGTIVSLPIVGVHSDPAHYEKPEMFDPERFAPERKNERNPYAFTPFGHGPRNCIGMRFALTEVKTAICSLVSNFQLEPCGRTEIPPKFGNTNTLKPLEGMWLKLRPRLED